MTARRFRGDAARIEPGSLRPPRAAWLVWCALLAGACSSSGEIAAPTDPGGTGAGGNQSVPAAGRAGAAGVGGATGGAGAGGTPIVAGSGGSVAGAGGSALTCPPDGAKVPECATAASQSCAGCVCGSPSGCDAAWSGCRDDVACARGLGCLLAGCPSHDCAVVAGVGHAKLVSVIACFGGACALPCTGEQGGAGGASGAGGAPPGGGAPGAGGASGAPVVAGAGGAGAPVVAGAGGG